MRGGVDAAALLLAVIVAAAHTATCAAQAAGGGLVCDGVVRRLSLPTAPYPTQNSYYYPIAVPSGVSCTRLLQSASSTPQENGFCGGRESVVCEQGDAVFGPIGPITHGTGGLGPFPYNTPGLPETVVPPSDPIIYSLTGAVPGARLSFASFTVIDVGTAGAKLVGVYGTDMRAGRNVTAEHAWLPNGDQGGSTRCGACSDCRVGFGVVNLTLVADAGMGFNAVQLSAKYQDARCGASCRDVDGMYWSGMEYACITVRRATAAAQERWCSATTMHA
jgi:hypothetical protein